MASFVKVQGFSELSSIIPAQTCTVFEFYFHYTPILLERFDNKYSKLLMYLEFTLGSTPTLLPRQISSQAVENGEFT